MQSLVASHRHQLGALSEVTHRLQYQKKVLDKNNGVKDIMDVGSYHWKSYLERQESNKSLVQLSYRDVMEHCKANEVEHTFEPITEDDRITINVSGLVFETYRKTLLQFPNTLLGNPERIEKFYEEDKKQYFLPRNRLAFDGILYYYQSGRSVYRPKNVSVMEFFEEMRFFELGAEILESYVQDENVCVDCLVDTPELVKDGETKNRRTLNRELFFAFLSISSIIICTVLLLLETIPSLYNAYGEDSLYPFHISFAVFFTVEYILRCAFSRSKKKFFFTFLTFLDLLSIPPFYIVALLTYYHDTPNTWYIRFLKFLRVLKLFQLGRHIEGMRIYAKTFCTSFKDILMMIFFLVVGMILFSSGAFYTQSSGVYVFLSIPDAFWYSVITMTTVGYGDVIPESDLGKLIGACCALAGLLVLALMVPIIAANFEKHYQEVKYSKRHRPCKIRRQNLQLNRKKQIRKSVHVLNTEKQANSRNSVFKPESRLGKGINNMAYVGSMDLGLNCNTKTEKSKGIETSTTEKTNNGVKPIFVNAEVSPWLDNRGDIHDSDKELSQCASPRSDLDRMDLDCDHCELISDMDNTKEYDNTRF